MKKYNVGYTQGVFDMFHIGHLNLLNNAREQCNKLIVGVNSDDLVLQYKRRKTVIGETERVEIIRNIKAVDEACLVDTLDKVKLQKIIGFDVVFIGSDWQGDKRWQETEYMLAELGVDVKYLPYTKNISSTILRLEKENAIKE